MSSHSGSTATLEQMNGLSSSRAKGLLDVMTASLGDLGNILETLDERSNEYTGDGPVQRTTYEIHELSQKIQIHSRAQDERLREAKKMAQDGLKTQVSDQLRHEINEYIRSEIVTQVRQQVGIQITHYIPVSLEQQALDNKAQLKELQTSLKNSEARIRNSSIQSTDQDEPLVPILKRDGAISNLYPADLRSLLFYEDEVVKELVREYDLAEDELCETNLKRFMKHIGIEFDLKIVQ